ncbi:MAG: (2Fe-2S) ferredoxin domain-containing protein [Legionella sp.]|nr:(2Fe-2S) ferredoxin domain-containing protein [Legionella sp.]
MAYYAKHILMCTNQKIPGKQCCANSGGEPFFDYMKSKLLELGMHGPGKIRVSKSGCLGRCSSGPCIVIYPEGIWFTYSSYEDLNQIIQNYIINNQVVDSLLIE